MEIENKSVDDDDTEIIAENASRLVDLIMALSFYNPAMAKTSLALALGTICGHEEEGPCLHDAFDIAEDQAEFVLQQKETETEKPEKSN